MPPHDALNHELQTRGLSRLLPYLPRLLHPFVRVMVTGSDIDTYTSSGRELNLELLDEVYFQHTDPTPTGISKLGGWPDIWPAFRWPQLNGRSLPLLAQLRMEDVAPYDEEQQLPAQGLLLIFYDFMADLSGESAAKALYFDGDFSTLSRAEIPANALRWETPDELAYQTPLLLKFCRDWQLADDDNLEFQSLSESLLAAGEPPLSETETQGYWRFLLDWNKGRCDTAYKRELNRSLKRHEHPSHQLLGLCYAGNVDGRLEAVCQSHNFPKFAPLTPAQEEQMLAEAPNWRLLFQLFSDDGLNWGDAGKISLFIERDALTKRDFSNVQVTYDG